MDKTDAINYFETANKEFVYSNYGFKLYRSLLSSDEISILYEEVLRLASVQDGAHHVEMDEFGNVIVMNDLGKESDWIFSLNRSAKLIKLAEYLLGKKVISLTVECFIKPRQSCSVIKPHQDHIFYRPHFHDELALSIWIALTEVNENSGPLVFYEAVYESILQHRILNSGAVRAYIEENLPKNKSSILMAPGDAVCFHSLAPHESGMNTSLSDRIGICFNFRGSPFLTERVAE